MRNIKQIKNLRGKKVIARVDFNVPLENANVTDDFRIKKALPTINFLRKKGAKVILISHLGKGEESLEPVAKVLNKYVKTKFVPQIVGEETTKTVAGMKNGEVVLLENLRKDKGEQVGDKLFAMNLAKLGEIYVNESFPVDHREDISIVVLPKMLPSYAGLQLEEEVKHLSLVFKKPKHPFLFILGGAKFSTKAPLIEKYLKLADHVFLGGALLNDFLKAKGYEVGKSLTDEGKYDYAKILKSKKLILPLDVIVASSGKLVARKVNEVKKDEIIIDIGPDAIKNIEQVIKKSKLILWNGPLGKYEDGGDVATKSILKMVAKSKATSIIGGGDTVAVISELKMEKKFTFVSTGGGATLDFLANGTLPGIKALN